MYDVKEGKKVRFFFITDKPIFMHRLYDHFQFRPQIFRLLFFPFIHSGLWGSKVYVMLYRVIIHFSTTDIIIYDIGLVLLFNLFYSHVVVYYIHHKSVGKACVAVISFYISFIFQHSLCVVCVGEKKRS